jgi:hypothetical protein
MSADEALPMAISKFEAKTQFFRVDVSLSFSIIDDSEPLNEINNV